MTTRKSTQLESLEAAENLLAEVWTQYLNGEIDLSLEAVQSAVNCQVSCNRIVWKINNIRNYGKEPK